MADDHSQNPSLCYQDGTPVLASFSADPSAPFQPPRVHQAGQQVSFPTVSHYAQAPQQQPAVGSQASYSSLLNSPLTPSPGGGGSFIEQQQALMVQQQQQKHLMLQQLQVQQQQKEVEQQRKELDAQAAEQQRVAAQQLHILSQAPGTRAGQGAQAPANAANAAAPDKPKPAEWTHDKTLWSDCHWPGPSSNNSAWACKNTTKATANPRQAICIVLSCILAHRS